MTIRDFDDWAAERMKDPGFREAVEKLEPGYQAEKRRILREGRKRMGKRKLRRRLRALRLQVHDLQNDYGAAYALLSTQVQQLECSIHGDSWLAGEAAKLKERVERLEQGREALAWTIPPEFHLEGEAADRIRAGILEQRVKELEQLCEKMRTQADWLEAAYGEFQCGIKAQCTNERCAQAQRCAHCAVSLGEIVEREGERMARFEDRLDQLEQGRDNDLGETVPLDVWDGNTPAFRLEGETADRIRAGIHEHAHYFTGDSRTSPQPRSILGCAGPNEIGMATDGFLEQVPGW